MLISQAKLSRDSLKDQVAVVTGAGRGIGYEAARALLWLGAKVAVAEVNENNGKIAARSLEKEFGAGKVFFFKTDVGNAADVEKLKLHVAEKWGKVDIVVNNAAVYPVGAVQDLPLDVWENSCRVNLQAPILLAKAFVPDMVQQKRGVFLCLSSSGSLAYLGAHEVFKTAQAELAHTLASELEGTCVYAVAVNPGIVKTPGFVEAGGQAAALKGTTLEQLLQENQSSEFSAEEAGLGLAAAAVLAEKFNGQEVTTAEALQSIGVNVGGKAPSKAVAVSKTAESQKVNELYQKVMTTFDQQLKDWRKSNLFRKQFATTDFKKNTEMTPEEMLSTLERLGDKLENGSPVTQFIEPLKTLAGFYEHQLDLLRGFEKVQKKRQEGLDLVASWLQDVKALIEALGG